MATENKPATYYEQAVVSFLLTSFVLLFVVGFFASAGNSQGLAIVALYAFFFGLWLIPLFLLLLLLAGLTASGRPGAAFGVVAACCTWAVGAWLLAIVGGYQQQSRRQTASTQFDMPKQAHKIIELVNLTIPDQRRYADWENKEELAVVHGITVITTVTSINTSWKLQASAGEICHTEKYIPSMLYLLTLGYDDRCYLYEQVSPPENAIVLRQYGESDWPLSFKERYAEVIDYSERREGKETLLARRVKAEWGRGYPPVLPPLKCDTHFDHRICGARKALGLPETRWQRTVKPDLEKIMRVARRYFSHPSELVRKKAFSEYRSVSEQGALKLSGDSDRLRRLHQEVLEDAGMMLKGEAKDQRVFANVIAQSVPADMRQSFIEEMANRILREDEFLQDDPPVRLWLKNLSQRNAPFPETTRARARDWFRQLKGPSFVAFIILQHGTKAARKDAFDLLMSLPTQDHVELVSRINFTLDDWGGLEAAMASDEELDQLVQRAERVPVADLRKYFDAFVNGERGRAVRPRLIEMLTKRQRTSVAEDAELKLLAKALKEADRFRPVQYPPYLPTQRP